MKHTLSVLVQNEAGVLSSLSGLFSGRGYNIESLTVAPTVDNDYSRVTIVTSGDEKVIEHMKENTAPNRACCLVNQSHNHAGSHGIEKLPYVLVHQRKCNCTG